MAHKSEANCPNDPSDGFITSSNRRLADWRIRHRQRAEGRFGIHGALYCRNVLSQSAESRGWQLIREQKTNSINNGKKINSIIRDSDLAGIPSSSSELGMAKLARPAFETREILSLTV